MCKTKQVLLLSDDLTSTLIMLINTSFNFGLKIKAFSRGQMLVSSNSFAKNVSYYHDYELISLFSKLKCRGAQHKWFLWSIYFDFLLFCFVVICDLLHTMETVHGIYVNCLCSKCSFLGIIIQHYKKNSKKYIRMVLKINLGQILSPDCA